MIIIAGDSWSLGEWDKQGQLSHPGLGGFLQEANYKVWNVGLGGGSNNQTIHRLELALNLAKQNKETVSKVFVFQTDWFRDLHNSLYSLSSTRKNDVLANALVHNHHYRDEFKDNIPITFRAFIEHVINYFYIGLSNLGIQYNVDIGVIGGCSDTIVPTQSFGTTYPRLSIACHSITNLVLKTRSADSVYALYNVPSYLNFIQNWIKQIFLVDLQGVIDEMERSNHRLDLFVKYQDSFFPDCCHANRVAHQQLFNLLKDTNQLPNEI